MTEPIRLGNWIPCEFCGKTVYRTPSIMREHVYCSRLCANRGSSKIIQEHPELRDGPLPEIPCKQCGKLFTVPFARYKVARFCSKYCGYAYRAGRANTKPWTTDRIGANNSNFKGTNNTETARVMALRVFPERCLICGFDTIVEVHHVNPRRHGGTNDIENLAVLCPNHHKMADRKLISQDELKALVMQQLNESKRE